MKKFLTRRVQLVPEEMIYPGMFDLAKGILMLSVLALHCITPFYPVLNTNLDPSARMKVLILVYQYLFSIQIPVLFVVCGFSWRKRSFRKVISLHTRTLIKPFLYTVIVLLGLSVLNALVFDRPMLSSLAWTGIPLVLCIIPGDTVFFGISIHTLGPLWCIIAYILSSVLLNFIVDRRENWEQFVLVVLSVCTGFMLMNVTLPFCLHQTLICTGFMYLGWYIKRSDFFSKSIPVYLLLLCIAFSVFCLPTSKVVIAMNQWGSNPLIDMSVLSLASVLYILLLLRGNFLHGLIFQFIRWFGRNAFVVCCLHSILSVLPYEMLGVFYGSLSSLFQYRPISVLVLFLINIIFCSVGLQIYHFMTNRSARSNVSHEFMQER